MGQNFCEILDKVVRVNRGATTLLVAVVKRYHKLSVTVHSNYHTSREYNDSYIQGKSEII